jgi:hypothetical protein
MNIFGARGATCDAVLMIRLELWSIARRSHAAVRLARPLPGVNVRVRVARACVRAITRLKASSGLARCVYLRGAMRSDVVIAFLVVAITGTASAQPGLTAPSVPPRAGPQGTQRPSGGLQHAEVPAGWELSESTAVWLSVGGTAASWGLILAATQLDGSGTGVATLAALCTIGAPGLGHMYADSFATRGLALRFGGAGIAFLAAILGTLGDTGRLSDRDLVTSSMLLGGAALLAAGTIDDIVTAPAAVRRYNWRLSGLAITPMLGPDRGGIALAANF